MADLMYCLINLLFFDILLLYYYNHLNSSIICFLFSVDIYLSFGNSSLASSVERISFARSSPKHSSFKRFEIPIILFAI